MRKINICVCSGLHILALLFLVGCSQPQSEPPAEVAATEVVPVVATLSVTPKPLDVFEVLPGRVVAVRSAEIRPQVTGIVKRRLFAQGSEVKAGQPLFQIEAAPFQAEADIATADAQKAEVSLQAAISKVNRLQPLIEVEAISRQEYDDAVAAREEARAQVAQAKATLDRRLLDVDFATVTAPISGLIDQTLVSEGALVSSTDSTPMAQIQQIDQVFVDIRQPAASLDATRRLLSNPAAKKIAAKTEILRSDGSAYPVSGQILFSGVSVDSSTGDVLLRVLVNNTQRALLPGMLVNARVMSASNKDALSVPQQAVVHVAEKAHVWTIDANNQAHMTPVELGALVNGYYHIVSGIDANAQVVIEGIDRLQDKTVVKRRPWTAPKAPNTPIAS